MQHLSHNVFSKSYKGKVVLRYISVKRKKKEIKLIYFPSILLPSSIHYKKDFSYKKYNLLSSSGMTQITPFISQKQF